MKIKIMLILFLSFGLFSSIVQATTLSDIEVFDVKKEKVVKSVANSEKIQEEIQPCLKTISGITRRLNPIPKDGQIIKIPVQPSIMVNNQWVNALIDEVKLIIPTNETPILMLFDEENKPYFLEFQHDIKFLLSKIEK